MVRKHLKYSDDDTIYAWCEVNDGFFVPITGKGMREFSLLKYIWFVIKFVFFASLGLGTLMFCLIWAVNGWDDAIDTTVGFWTGVWEITKATWDLIKFFAEWLWELQTKK